MCRLRVRSVNVMYGGVGLWSIEVLKFEKHGLVWTVMVVIEKWNILKREYGWAGQNRR